MLQVRPTGRHSGTSFKHPATFHRTIWSTLALATLKVLRNVYSPKYDKSDKERDRLNRRHAKEEVFMKELNDFDEVSGEQA